MSMLITPTPLPHTDLPHTDQHRAVEMTSFAAAFHPARPHGGPGPHGAARFDFSTTANACGPCPASLRAIRAADYQHYPDSSYRELRQQLADMHRVTPERILLAASASEFIFRATAMSAPAQVVVPQLAYGDYLSAAQAYRCPTLSYPMTQQAIDDAANSSTRGSNLKQSDRQQLVWFANPSSPLGQATPAPLHLDHSSLMILDRSCAPLQLEGADSWPEDKLAQVFQLFSPNKALGLTGVRAAYAIAPNAPMAAAWVARLEAACPSWPLGAAGVALLTSWTRPEVQQWLSDSRQRLLRWKVQQQDLLRDFGFTVLPSVTNFFVVQPSASLAPITLKHLPLALQAAGLAWRDTTSFGVPQAWRVSVQPPQIQARLRAALKTWLTIETERLTSS